MYSPATILSMFETIVAAIIKSNKVPIKLNVFINKSPYISSSKVNTGASVKVQKLSQQALSKHVLEIDLHIEKLVGRKVTLMNSEMLEIQLRKVTQVLTENRNNRGLKIILIHGNGKGVLKNEILKLLKRNFSTYKISDASMQKYGTGALEVQV